MVIDVCDAGGVVEVGVEELQMLAQAVPGGHTAAQAVIAVLDGPAGRLAVDPLQKTCGGGHLTGQPMCFS